MLFLKKFLAIFVLPLGLVFLLLAFAWWRRRRWPAVLAAVLLYLSSTGFVASWLQAAVEGQYPPVALASAGSADAVVVLGGIFGPPVAEGLLPNIGEAGERLEAGIRLAQQGRAPLLVFTGARYLRDDRVIIEGELSRREAMARGIGADRILVTAEVEDTADEAGQVAALARKRGWQRVILVTSALHMPRSARMFRSAGVPIAPFPVDYRYDPLKALSPLDFLPNANALATTESVLRECYGIAFYALLGR